jgi:ribonuclease BN (tRNA processing enzyme)
MASSDPPPSVYEFHSFHINIGVGDGSIHLLVDVSKTDVKPQGKVVQAILIDGGEGHGEYVANIFSTVDRIKLEYEFPADDGDELKFDSIIVTHWDSDHYGGLIRFLRLGFVDGYEKANRVLADARIPFLRYSGDVPATTLYAPYWVDESPICGPCGKLQADPDMPRTADDSTGLTGNDEAWMKLNPGSLEEPESSDDEGSKKKKKKKAKKKITRPNWPRILRLKTGAKNLLGMNFLNGQMPTTEDQTELNTPQKLLNKNQPGDGKPGMYCVAVNNVMLGETDEADTNPPYPTSQLQRRPGDGSGGPPPFGPRPIIDNPLKFGENSVDKNVRSVSCIVLWKDGDGVRLSHYFAGDAMWTIEAQIFDWIKAAKTFTVTAMKISHHGAVNATPLTFLDELDPGKLIVSAGKDIRHGHPSKVSHAIVHDNELTRSCRMGIAVSRLLLDSLRPCSTTRMFLQHQFPILPDSRRKRFE